ncbi:MAG: T9SS type A sorting domain-containing protein, partial [Saprospiraceae bacterium]|nr:T9SS type A sorting domain-containing protein [Saprospiraceae bacterium]
ALGKPQANVATFSILPNPASDNVVLKLVEMQEPQEVTAEVYNQFGQLMLRKDFGVVTYLNEQFDLGSFKNGLYFLSLKIGEAHFEQKLVVSKN